MGNLLTLYPRDQIKEGMRVSSQTGTPYGMTTVPFLSTLQVPCHKPPYGRSQSSTCKHESRSGIDRSARLTRSVPGARAFGFHLPMGVPIAAGSVITKGGLIFIGGTWIVTSARSM